MSVITNRWNDGSGDSINIESPSFQGNQTVKISSPVQKGTSKRSMQFIGKCKKDSSKQVILTVEQEASVYTYDLILSGDNTEIAAKGGTANITAVLKTYRNGNLVSTDNVTPVLSGSATGFSISGTKVTASNRTTTVGSRRSIVVTGKYSNTFDGQTVSSTITIYQEANEASYGALTGGSVSASDIPASGGTSSTSISNMSQTISYTSGSTRAGTVTYSKTSEITVSSLGTTVKARTKVGQVTVTYTGEGSVTANKTVDIYQAENKVTNSDITITKETPINLSAVMHINIKVSDGLSYSQKATYTSGATTDITTGANITYSVQNPVTGFTLSNNILSVTSNKSLNPRNGFVVRINILLNGKTAIKDITYNQAAGYYTYANPVVTLTCNDVPASGGSVKTGNVTYSQTYGWNGVTTGAGVITEGEAYISWTGGVDNIPSLGTTVKSRTKVGVLGVTVNINGKSGNANTDIYQEANAVIDDNYDEHLSSYGTPEMVILSNLITAAGGTARAAGVVRNTYTYYDLYTSGSTVPCTRTKAGVYKIEMISNGNNRFSMDDTYLITHSSMGANVTTDTAKFRCYNESDRTKYVDDSISVSNRIESYNYGSWNISISANPTSIPATGGTSTITSSCTRSKTPVYTSGSTGTATSESATPILALTTNPGGFTLSGNKLTAANNPIGAKTATVTASYSGATSKSVSVTQAAGPDGIGYMQIQGDGTNHPIFRVGGATRSVEPMSINETSETASDEDVSIFASIKKFLAKFV